jgi:hypothetical protein
LLVAVNEPWRNRADVRAGTDEQEDDEQKGLEIEERGLRRSIGAQRSHQSGQERKYVEKYGPWDVEDCALLLITFAFAFGGL